jgi:YggT family protein
VFVFGNFFQALAQVLGYAIDILWWLIIIRALLSWVNPDPYNMIVQFIERTTEPILQPLRQLIPIYKIGIDISPILAMLILYFIKIFAVSTLLGIGARLQ